MNTATIGRGLLLVALLTCSGLYGQVPNHPVITEVYTDPSGLNDGPFGRDVTNQHQEYIEIYLPPSASLAAGLNKDALRLAFYEVEGDSTSTGLGLMNYRFDLPTFDLDSSNGITAGAIARPSSGIVVLGWVDYSTTTPVVLAGTPSTRVAMVNGGVTATDGTYTFIAINGAHGTGTTNFPIPTAENLIDMPAEAGSGIIQNGSAAYLLVNRDSPSYVMLCDDAHTIDCPAGSAPDLPNNAVGLNTPALLDGLAGNDHSLFLVTDQPYVSPTGSDIDLETILPAGGAFSLLTAQVPEEDLSVTYPGIANGYARFFVDVPKTTETVAADNPVTDATTAYRHIRNNGPFFATPGRAVLSTTAPELGVAVSAEHMVQLLAQTTARPPVLTANVGGNFGINLSTSAGASSNPAVATFAAGSPANGVMGQTLAFPTVAVTGAAGAAHNATATSTITVTATNAVGGNPAVVAPVQNTTMTATVLKPTTGLNSVGAPFQTTVFAAIQGIPANAGVLNEFRPTSLGTYVATNLGGAVQDSKLHGATLINPATDIGNGLVMQAMVSDGLNYPDPGFFINRAGPPGKLDLLQTVTGSAEVLSGATSYDGNYDLTGVRARRVNIPDTLTSGGTFSPTESLHFADATGRVGDTRSGLTNATTTRTFELAILETNVNDNSTLETGANDDFGIIIEVAAVEAGSPVAVGEFVFLSFTGGLQGADIDGVSVPSGDSIASVIFLDTDNLHTILGISSIEAVILLDAGSAGQLDPVEVFSLKPVTVPTNCTTNAQCSDQNPCTQDICDLNGVCQNPPVVCSDGLSCTDDSCAVLSVNPPVFQCRYVANDVVCSQGNPSPFCSAQICDPLANPNVNPTGCVFDNECVSANGNPCENPATCDEQADNCGGCLAPAAFGSGGRYLAVTPPATQGSTPVAVRVDGDCAEPAVSCVSKYLTPRCVGGPNDGLSCLSDADCPKQCLAGPNNGNTCTSDSNCPAGSCRGVCDKGFMGDTPTYLPASSWGTVHVHGAQLRPAGLYHVYSVCNFGGPPTVSAATQVRAAQWGNTNNDDTPVAVDFSDISAVVNAFRGFYSPLETYQSTNIMGAAANACGDVQLGCVGQECLNFGDVAATVDAFRGAVFPCPAICP